MRAFAAVAALLLLATASAQSSDVTALQGLQKCIQNSKNNIAYVNGWGLGLSTAGQGTASTGRKLLQTEANCAAAAAISSAIPCTPQNTPSTPSTPSTPPTAGASPGTSTTPSGVPTGTSSNPCGDTSNPVPWTGLLCTNGQVTSVLLSQLGPNIFQGTCDLSTLSDLSGLSAVTNVDFTDAGVSGTVPASWGNGSWSGSLQSLVLAQNPNITGPIPDLSQLQALQSVDLSNSSFSGPVNISASGYPKLVSFTAFGNKLTGSLPASLPANLTTLGLGKNQLNGTLPAYNSSTLSYLQVNGNNLTGCLPSGWPSSLKNITNIDISYNQLSGPIPDTWQASGAFPTLQTINLVGNGLCGSLGSLGTPVAPVGQNNPNATRLVPNPGSLPACSGNGCSGSGSGVFAAAANGPASQLFALAPGPAGSDGIALSPFTAPGGSGAPAAQPLPVLPQASGR